MTYNRLNDIPARGITVTSLALLWGCSNETAVRWLNAEKKAGRVYAKHSNGIRRWYRRQPAP